MDNLGKKFELKLKEDFSKIEGSSIDRIYDTVNGLKGVSNISDFIAYVYPNIYYIECKTHKGASFPFANLPQYDKLVSKVGIKGVRTGVVVWLYEKDLIAYVPISTIKRMKELGKKSISYKDMQDESNALIIPSIKKRVFFDSDYSVMLNLSEGW